MRASDFSRAICTSVAVVKARLALQMEREQIDDVLFILNDQDSWVRHCRRPLPGRAAPQSGWPLVKAPRFVRLRFAA
jgi:hypothetical protein